MTDLMSSEIKNNDLDKCPSCGCKYILFSYQCHTCGYVFNPILGDLFGYGGDLYARK